MPKRCGDELAVGNEICDSVTSFQYEALAIDNTLPSDALEQLFKYCTSDCKMSEGWYCDLGQNCDYLSEVSTRCGDGIAVGFEDCDDGNSNSNDGCSSECKVESGFVPNSMYNRFKAICGNNLRQGVEECDYDVASNPSDPLPKSGDGCSSTCKLEKGYVWDINNQRLATVCGDKIVNSANDCEVDPFDSASAFRCLNCVK